MTPPSAILSKERFKSELLDAMIMIGPDRYAARDALWYHDAALRKDRDKWKEEAGMADKRHLEAQRLFDESEAALQRRANRQKDFHDWSVATFGEATIESTMRRIDKELREFYEDPVGEAKDIAIFLYQLMSVAGKNLDAEVDSKMEINRKRTWVLSGDGCGQHTGSTAKKGLMEEILELRSEIQKALDVAVRATEAYVAKVKECAELERERDEARAKYSNLRLDCRTKNQMTP